MIIVIPKNNDKLIKITLDDQQCQIHVNTDNDIEIVTKLSTVEKNNLLNTIFGTTNIGMINCNDIKEDCYYCPSCKRILELTEIDSCADTPNKIVDYCLYCNNEIINLKK